MQLSWLNPFRKKFVQFNGTPSLPRTNYFLNQFGNFTVNWDKYINPNQDNNLLIDKYNSLSELSAPINKFATGATQVMMEVFKESGKKANDPTVNKLISDFWTKYADLAVIYYQLTGNVYIAKLNQITLESLGQSVPTKLYLLPTQNTRIVLRTIDNVDYRLPEITSYFVEIDTFHKNILIDATDCLHIKHNNPLTNSYNYLYGISPIISNSKNIKSLEAAYSAKVSLYSKGPRLLLTGKQQGEFAAANAMSGETVDEVQKRFNEKYGLGENQFQVMATDIPLDATVISMNIQQLQINENNQKDFEKICASLDVDPRAVSDVSGSTFNNVDAALTNFYNGSFKRLMDYFAQRLTELVQTTWPKYYIKPNYERISYIIEANKKYNAEKLAECEKGLITRNEYLEFTGQDKVNLPVFNEYYTFSNGAWTPVIAETQNNEGDNLEGVSQEQLQAQANLRGTVGGVQGILAIQASVAVGTTDYAAALETLVEIYGFSRETATLILGTPRTPNQPNAQTVNNALQNENNNSENI